jgi:hypothetical protein
LIAQAEKALQSATAKSSTQQRTLGALRTSAKALPLDAADRSEVGQQLAQCSTALERVCSIKPDTGSLFVRLFLGQVNVRVASTEDRRTLKAEYEKFRYRTNFGFIIFPLVWILDYVYLRNVWKHTHWINILTHVWLLYYYVSLALRTNILKVVSGQGGGERGSSLRVRAPGSPHLTHPPHPCTHTPPRTPHPPPPPPLPPSLPERLQDQALVDHPPLRQRLHVHCGAHLAARVPQL